VLPLNTYPTARCANQGAPLAAGGGKHDFAGKLVAVTTVEDVPARGDQGGVLGLGVIVSQRVCNFLPDDARRVTLGAEFREEYQDNFYFVLVLEAYDPPYNFADLNDKDGPHEARFQWGVVTPGGPRLNSIKMVSFGVARSITQHSIRDIGAELKQMREEGTLEGMLSGLDMKRKMSGRRSKDITGMYLRGMLLVELLLEGTFAAPLLAGGEVAAVPGAPAEGDAGGVLPADVAAALGQFAGERLAGRDGWGG
jgi:hypothetical protein